MTLNDSIYEPVLGALADHKLKSLAQLQQSVKSKDGQTLNLIQLSEVMAVLSHTGAVMIVQDDKVVTKVKKQTEALNQKVILKARSSGEISFLASPLTGGGILVQRFHQLFLLAIQNGAKTPTEMAQSVWQVLASQGQRLMKEGQAIKSAEDNIAELTEQAASFAELQLPILKALKIA